MTKPPKTVFDFPREQWDRVEVRSLSGSDGWLPQASWVNWMHRSLEVAEARLVKREPRTVSGERTLNELRWLVVLCPNLAPGCHVRYTITEVIEGADPEPDWKAKCERLTKCINKLVDVHQQDRKLIAQRDTRIGELEEEKSNLLNSHNHNMKVRIEKDNRIRELEGAQSSTRTDTCRKSRSWRS
jgi:hypothetical protein